MPRPRAWITGAGGLVGSHLVALAPTTVPDWEVIPLTRPVLDLRDFAAVDRRFAADSPDLVIHTAALSRSPACQSDPALARHLNVDVTRHLAGLFAGRLMIFFSSDLVFDGRRGHYLESDAPNALSVYAETKVLAEQFVLSHPHHAVIRTSLNYGRSPTGDRAFNEDMLRVARAGRRLPLFVDEFRCPIPVEATARATWQLARLLASPTHPRTRPGLFHLAGAERLSRWDIGQLVARLEPELRAAIEPSSLDTYTGAPRPPDTSLDCSRLQALLDFPLPRFSDWVADRVTHRPGPVPLDGPSR